MARRHDVEGLDIGSSESAGIAGLFVDFLHI